MDNGLEKIISVCVVLVFMIYAVGAFRGNPSGLTISLIGSLIFLFAKFQGYWISPKTSNFKIISHKVESALEWEHKIEKTTNSWNIKGSLNGRDVTLTLCPASRDSIKVRVDVKYSSYFKDRLEIYRKNSMSNYYGLIGLGGIKFGDPNFIERYSIKGGKKKFTNEDIGF